MMKTRFADVRFRLYMLGTDFLEIYMKFTKSLKEGEGNILPEGTRACGHDKDRVFWLGGEVAKDSLSADCRAVAIYP